MVCQATTAAPPRFTDSSRYLGRVPSGPDRVSCRTTGRVHVPESRSIDAFTTRPATHTTCALPRPSTATSTSAAPRVPGTATGRVHPPVGRCTAVMTRVLAPPQRTHDARAGPPPHATSTSHTSAPARETGSAGPHPSSVSPAAARAVPRPAVPPHRAVPPHPAVSLHQPAPPRPAPPRRATPHLPRPPQRPRPPLRPPPPATRPRATRPRATPRATMPRRRRLPCADAWRTPFNDGDGSVGAPRGRRARVAGRCRPARPPRRA